MRVRTGRFTKEEHTITSGIAVGTPIPTETSAQDALNSAYSTFTALLKN